MDWLIFCTIPRIRLSEGKEILMHLQKLAKSDKIITYIINVWIDTVLGSLQNLSVSKLLNENFEPNI